MIEVRIRCDYEADGKRLCDWPATELGALLPAIGRWGLYTEAGEYLTGDLMGQVRYTDNEAYFEIIVSTEDA